MPSKEDMTKLFHEMVVKKQLQVHTPHTGLIEGSVMDMLKNGMGIAVKFTSRQQPYSEVYNLLRINCVWDKRRIIVSSFTVKNKCDTSTMDSTVSTGYIHPLSILYLIQI